MRTKHLTNKLLRNFGLALGLVLATATILTPTAQASETLIPDQALATCINHKLAETETERTENTPISQNDLQKLTDLSCVEGAITDLSGLEQATNLNHLFLPDNKITDITPLAKLTNLNHLYLRDNKITDITPLAKLTNLTHLYLTNNKITDITPLAKLTNLTHLYLTNNKITDITPLAKLTNLTHLYLRDNKITDITPLAKLTNLTHLFLRDNKITDITPLAKLTNLTRINLSENEITDVTPLAKLTNLTDLLLDGNKITDITPLAKLTNLTHLYLRDNKITDITPLAKLTNLTHLYLDGNPLSSFTDIISYPFVKEINWLASSGVTTGYSDGSFRPHDSVSRAAMAAFIYRLEGKPAYNAPARSPFKDIKPGDAFYKEICWLASKGITTGYAGGTFKPWDPIARDAMAAFLHRYDTKVAAKKLATKLAAKKFTDTAATPFTQDIAWLSSTGVTTGYQDGSFRPFENIERGAIAAFFYRMKH